MSTNASRLIVVDDTDSQIRYTGPWFLDQGSENGTGDLGPPFRSTMHGTNANASLSFAFNGTQIMVYGSSNLRNDSGVLDPSWECFIDNISIGATPPWDYQQNNWLFCEHDSLVDGPHNLTVKATVMKNQTFWFDDIQYLPSATVPLDEASIVVGSLDPQLQYGQGWEAIATTTTYMTSTNGSTFTFNFFGVRLNWYGSLVSQHSTNPDQSVATYSIDGQTPTSFILNGHPNASTSFNQNFFQTALLPAGPHTLKVVFLGNAPSEPLTLDYLVIQNGTASSSSSSITGGGVSGTSTRGTTLGAIIGGVVGGLVLVFAILGFLRRRQKRAAEGKVLNFTPHPFDFDYTALPPSHTGGTPNSGPSSSQITQMGRAVTSGSKRLTYHASMPSLGSIQESSQSTLPRSNLCSPATHPANVHPASLLRTALTNASTSVPTLLPPSNTLRPQNTPADPAPMQSDDSHLPSVVFHEDSGVRMPSSPAHVDVPPLYTPD